jgi:FPC/CPF motif-containing protein YcgG
MCQRVGHDKLKSLVNTLEDTMKARWQAAEAANNRTHSEDWGYCDANRPLYIQCLLLRLRSALLLLTIA